MACLANQRPRRKNKSEMRSSEIEISKYMNISRNEA